MSNAVQIKFSPNQKLPPLYRIEWWKSDEHYRWVISDDIYGCEHANRFRARRDAWAHYKTALRKAIAEAVEVAIKMTTECNCEK